MRTPVSTLLRGKSSELHALGPDATVADAVHEMNRHDIGAVLVMDPEQTLLGIFTERDVLRRVIEKNLDHAHTPLEQVMTRKVICLRPETPVQDALALVSSHNIRHLPVVENERVLGMISVRDLSTALVNEREHELAELTDYIYGSYGGHAGG